MNHKELENYILTLPNTRLDFPFGEDVCVYKVFITEKSSASQADAVQGGNGQSSEAYKSMVNENVPAGDAAMRGDWKMFALIPQEKSPVSISLKCDPQLAILLRERYESVMEGYHLNKRHWNTMLMTGQLTDQEVKDLILHSYNLVTGHKAEAPNFD